MTLGMVKFNLQPSWLTRVEQRVSTLFRPDGAKARYALEGLLRGDSTARAAFYRALWEIGVLSTNDILQLEDRPGIGADGDVRYRPLAMGQLGQPNPSETEEVPADVEA
jgi:hypothetical protein